MTEAAPEETSSFLGFQTSDRVELLSTIVLAVAAILTAWTAFQAGKWSGVQSIRFSEAGAARTESTRFSTLAGQQAQVDISLFVDWVSALESDLRNGLITEPTSGSAYEPTQGTLSGFLFLRMREEMAPALTAWLATSPLSNPAAPASPFELPEYQLAAQADAERLKLEADDKAALAREANKNGDNYVVTTVLFATVLFFAGVSGKMALRRNRIIVLTLGVVLLLATAFIVARLPIEPSSFDFF